MSESCVQGLGCLAVVGPFPFSDFHETTEQTKMASLIPHHGGRWLRQNDLESRLASRKKITHLTHSEMSPPLCISHECVDECVRKKAPASTREVIKFNAQHFSDQTTVKRTKCVTCLILKGS